jgi:transcriptional regulator with XRE-family HTH domain
MKRLRSLPRSPGLALALLRVIRGWSQEELAQESGWSVASLQAWESGARTLAKETLDELAAHLEFEPLKVDGLLLGLRGVVEPFEPLPEAAPSIELPPETLDRIRLEALEHGLAEAHAREKRATDEACARQIARDREAADALVRRLLPLAPEEREAFRKRTRSAGFYTWAFVERVCEQSLRSLPHDLQGARDWAQLALASAWAEEDAVELRQGAYAWAFLANVERVAQRFDHAESYFLMAARDWWDGRAATALPLEEWRLHELVAAFHRDNGNAELALVVHEEALKRAENEARLFALVGKAETLEGLDRHREALDTLLLARHGLGEGQPADASIVLGWKLADLLSRLGRAEEALRHLAAVRRKLLEGRNQRDLSLCLWLQARCEAGLGRAGEAAKTYRQALVDLLAQRRGREAIECMLELADLYLKLGKTDAAKRLAQESGWVQNLDKLADPVRDALQRIQEEGAKGSEGLRAIREALAELRRTRPRTRP